MHRANEELELDQHVPVQASNFLPQTSSVRNVGRTTKSQTVVQQPWFPRIKGTGREINVWGYCVERA